jgi:ribokinase
VEHRVAVLGIFAADLAFRAERLPRMGETLLGRGFALGPGGKGSNQAVAARRAGAAVSLVSRVGDDPFGRIARDLWAGEGIDTGAVATSATPTGTAFIFVHAETGENAIIVEPGAASELSPESVEGAAATIRSARVFLTQLEQPVAAARRGLEIARAAGVTTILNPAPGAPLDDGILRLCDYVTPNESEATVLTGIPIADEADARRAAQALLAAGAGCAIVTLGERGALFQDGRRSELVPAFRPGAAIDTTGAGDAFNGAFAAALAEGTAPLAAARFACAAAGLSVTRRGTAAAMPTRAEIEAVLARGAAA